MKGITGNERRGGHCRRLCINSSRHWQVTGQRIRKMNSRLCCATICSFCTKYPDEQDLITYWAKRREVSTNFPILALSVSPVCGKIDCNHIMASFTCSVFLSGDGGGSVCSEGEGGGGGCIVNDGKLTFLAGYQSTKLVKILSVAHVL